MDNGDFQSDNIFGNLQAGEYEVKVRDSEGCIFSGSARVTTTVSLAGNIMPIINANCAISGCHNGSQSPNLSTPNSVISNANSIKSQTQSGAMPKDATLDQASIDAIACWVDDGAPDN